MVLAEHTTASPAAIWAIVAVAVGCLAFWLGAVVMADRHPYVRHPQVPDMPGPVLGGTHLAEGGRSVSPDRDAPAVFTDAEVIELTAPVMAGPERPGGPPVPEQRGTEPLPASGQEARQQPPVAKPLAMPATPGMPAQRAGEGDQAKPSAAGPGSTHDD
jgi:hypothetical protein